jgi:hypothetical protein
MIYYHILNCVSSHFAQKWEGGIHLCVICTKNELSISQGRDWTESPKVYGIKASPCMESNSVCMESPKAHGIKPHFYGITKGVWNQAPLVWNRQRRMESNSVCMESSKVYGIKPPLAFSLDFFLNVC